MRRLSARFFIAAVAFAVGVAAATLWPSRRLAPPAVHISSPPVAPVLTEVEAPDDETKVERRYVNYTYGFSVDLPAGMVGGKTPPPAPAHGFGIDLDNPRSNAWVKDSDFPKSYVYVDGSYNSLLWATLDEAVEAHMNYVRGRGGEVTLLSKTATRLAGLRAVRLVIRHEKNGETMINDVILAFRGAADVEAVYTIDLYTPAANYERDKAVADALQRNWSFHAESLP